MLPLIFPAMQATRMAFQLTRMAPVALTACALAPVAFGLWTIRESRYLPNGVTRTINVTVQATASVGLTSSIANIISCIFGLPSEWTLRGLIVIRDTVSNGIRSLRQRNDIKALDLTASKIDETQARMDEIIPVLTTSNKLEEDIKKSLESHQANLEEASKAKDEHIAQLNVMVGTAMLINDAVDISPVLPLIEQAEEVRQEVQKIELRIAQHRDAFAAVDASHARTAAKVEATAEATSKLIHDLSELVKERRTESVDKVSQLNATADTTIDLLAKRNDMLAQLIALKTKKTQSINRQRQLIYSL